MKSLKLFSWSNTFRFEKEKKPSSLGGTIHAGQVYILGAQQSKQKDKLIQELALDWQKSDLQKSSKDVLHFMSAQGAIWIVLARKAKPLHSANALTGESAYSQLRDLSGSLVTSFRSIGLKKVFYHFEGLDPKSFEAVVMGMDLASYQYKLMESPNPFVDLPEVVIPMLNSSLKKIFDSAQVKARAVNRARHLVNMPPNLCNPETIEKMLKAILPKNLKMEVWQKERLIKENMHLHLSVGQGSATPPRMIRLSYRPMGRKKSAPIAFVGKGITFDTGGLDIKPSSGMRLMKKDMGGAASVLSLALFAAEAKLDQACDFYLALAENSVDQNSFRPSDVYASRAGYRVEIDNTDAEGRLVLADVLDVAVTHKEEPSLVIDVATLTGACRVALGTEVAGLFSNDDKLAKELMRRSHEVGDYCWQVPLVERYFGSYSSAFADFKNSGDGMGGAITAALFLQKFVRGKKWAHLDAYCWNDKPTGSLSFVGGSGQTVQLLMSFLES